MKRERILYTFLVLSALTMFSFEMVIKRHSQKENLNMIEPDQVFSLSIDIPADIYFVSGNEEKVILEGQPEILKNIDLVDNNGHIALQLSAENNLFQNVKTFLRSKETIKLYVTSKCIESILVADNNGKTQHSALFNGDRGILKVENSSFLNMIKAGKERQNCNQTMTCRSDVQLTGLQL